VRIAAAPSSRLDDYKSPMATPASCSRLLLPALVLAVERIAASDRRRPAVGDKQGSWRPEHIEQELALNGASR
jgi:hypothetical protein